MRLEFRPRRRALALAVAALVSAARPAHAEPGEQLRISILTFGPGDHPFYKFGHNAILVVGDPRVPGDAVYNFGTFDFESPWLILGFLKGKLNYWLSIQSLGSTISAYRSENRSIEAQDLELEPAQRKALADALYENARPENRFYKYDYYRDNCSTRVRDAIDRITGGKLREVSQDPARLTWRQHTLRLTADDLAVYMGLNVAMGDVIDRPIRVWDEMFLPARLQQTLRLVRVPGPEGQPLPLVRAERTLLSADRAPVRSQPPRWAPAMFGVGALFGGGLTLLGKRGSRSARVALGAALFVLGAVLGLFGLIFLMFWTMTDHDVAYHNENLFQCVPWGWGIAYAAVGLTRGRGRLAFRLTVAAAAASALGLFLKALPWFDQSNGQIIALLLPVWAGAAAGIYLLAKREKDARA
jgi:hypothetical protein